MESEVCAGLSLKCLSRGLCARLSGEPERDAQTPADRANLRDVNRHPADSVLVHTKFLFIRSFLPYHTL